VIGIGNYSCCNFCAMCAQAKIIMENGKVKVTMLKVNAVQACMLAVY
jgi:hypothetical protein